MITIEQKKIYNLLKILKIIIQINKQKNHKFMFVGYNSLLTTNNNNSNYYYIINKWPSGLLTNWDQIKKQINQLNTLKQLNLTQLTNKDFYFYKKKIIKLERKFNSIQNMINLPQMVIILEMNNSTKNILNECLLLGIPTICIYTNNETYYPTSFPFKLTKKLEYLKPIILNYLIDLIIK